MIVSFLGTGTSQGVPVIGCDCRVCRSDDPKDKRLRTSIHILDGQTSIVIDTGPDFRQQMLRENITKLDAVLFTHQHKDHVAGMDDIRSFYFRQKNEIPVYANAATLNQLRIEFPYVFNPGGYKGIPRIDIHEISDQTFKINDLSFQPLKLLHDQLTVLGFRFGDFTYITDANAIGTEAVEIISGTRIMVINALQKEPHPSHFTLSQALSEIERIKPEKAYLTHLSHRMGLHRDVSKELPKNVFLAYDGLKIKV